MLDRDAVALVVIDYQEKLLPKIHDADGVTGQAVKLIRFAKELDIPILWTEQYPKGLGPTVSTIAGELDGRKPLEKTAFGCMGDAGFTSALESTGRRQLLMIERRLFLMCVCVNQDELAPAGNRLPVPEAVRISDPRRRTGDIHGQSLVPCAQSVRSWFGG